MTFVYTISVLYCTLYSILRGITLAIETRKLQEENCNSDDKFVIDNIIQLLIVYVKFKGCYTFIFYCILPTNIAPKRRNIFRDYTLVTIQANSYEYVCIYTIFVQQKCAFVQNSVQSGPKCKKSLNPNFDVLFVDTTRNRRNFTVYGSSRIRDPNAHLNHRVHCTCIYNTSIKNMQQLLLQHRLDLSHILSALMNWSHELQCTPTLQLFPEIRQQLLAMRFLCRSDASA